ncbi:MAG: efflux RND transporter periplasmic adaptor subunit, partial [Hyphomonadaceae bacterium]|nr:efflux RND transporter periplasmic adaptor subunit [Hyphomonadaceae bacterium]
IALLALAAAGCSRAAPPVLQGYGEADYTYVSSQETGVVAEIFVHEGDVVEAGAPLFRLEGARLDYPLQSASAQRAALAQAVEVARANAELARVNFQRTAGLQREGFVSQARYDADRAALDAANARLEEARRQLTASGAEIGLWRERRSDLDGAAPSAGTIERIYHRAGEVVAAGQPIAALLTPENMKIRFFAPQAMLAQLPVGTQVLVSCDGCAAPATATVSFVAQEPQFTPPVIYSLDQRDKLVFLIEARLDAPGMIRPGMPVDVRLAP